MNKKVIIIGASGHGRVIADIVHRCGDILIGYLDDRPPECFPGLNVLGRVSDVIFAQPDTSFIIGIGNNRIRESIAERYPNLRYYTAIHPTAVIGENVEICEGTAIMANAVLNTGCRIGKHSIINTASTIDHDDVLEEFVHISPGAHISGTVRIGKGTWIGVGASVVNNVAIANNCMIGAGAVVVKNIEKPGIYKGVPAK